MLPRTGLTLVTGTTDPFKNYTRLATDPIRVHRVHFRGILDASRADCHGYFVLCHVALVVANLLIFAIARLQLQSGAVVVVPKGLRRVTLQVVLNGPIPIAIIRVARVTSGIGGTIELESGTVVYTPPRY